MPGAMILVGGDPGVGKSTLLLQVGTRCCLLNHRATYPSALWALICCSCSLECSCSPRMFHAVCLHTPLEQHETLCLQPQQAPDLSLTAPGMSAQRGNCRPAPWQRSA